MKKHANQSAQFGDAKRQGNWNIPLVMPREAIISALVRADSSQRSGPIRIAYYDDLIEIENPGILPAGLAIEDIKQGVSKIRNPFIVRVFRELKLVEQWGSGVARILRDAQERGLETPKFEELRVRLRVTIYFGRPESAVASKVLKLPQNDGVYAALSKSEIARHLGHHSISGELKKQIGILMAEGYIEYTLPEKPNSRLQKYRLTNVAREQLDK